MGRRQHLSVYTGREEADLAMKSCKTNPMTQSPSKYLLALLASSTHEMWTCSMIRFDRRHQSHSWQHKTGWHLGWNTALGWGRFGSAPALVPAASLSLVLAQDGGILGMSLLEREQGRMWGKGFPELWLRSLLAHATVLTSLRCAPPQPCSWFPVLVTDLSSELSCIPRKICQIWEWTTRHLIISCTLVLSFVSCLTCFPRRLQFA